MGRTTPKAEDAQNVLRVKAAVKEFETETNFSVITTDGHFYSFNVYYNSSPETLSYDLCIIPKTMAKTNTNDALFKELGNITPSLSRIVMETIYKNDKKIIKHISTDCYGIQFILKGIYIHNGKYFFHMQILNSSNVPFTPDLITFKVVDKKTVKRTAVQEIPLMPLRTYKALSEVGALSSDQNVFLLDQFTIDDKKVLLIEIFEKNGSRKQTLKVKNSNLLKSKSVKDLNLQF